MVCGLRPSNETFVTDLEAYKQAINKHLEIFIKISEVICSVESNNKGLG